jgi:hypothetical protein
LLTNKWQLLCGGARISLTFRTVATWRRLADGVVIGQGSCTFKDTKNLPPVLLPSASLPSLRVAVGARPSALSSEYSAAAPGVHSALVDATASLVEELKVGITDSLTEVDVSSSHPGPVTASVSSSHPADPVTASVSSSHPADPVIASVSSSHPAEPAAVTEETLEQQALEMLKSFSAENRDPHFRWEQHYSRGFDVINFDMLNKS